MSPWFKKWFESPDYLTVYSHRDENDADRLTKLILDNVTLPPGSKILDAGCGAGRHVLKFSEAGFKTFGFDLSINLLKQAKQNLIKNGKEVNLFRSDVREAYVKKEFNMVLNLFTSFGYFDSDEENFLFIKNAVNFLLPEGYYVLDYFNKDYLENNLVKESEREVGKYIVKEERKIVEDRIVKHIVIRYNGTKKEFKESVKIYEPSTLIEIFSESGYTLHKLFGNYDGDDFNGLKSERFIAIFKV